MSGCSEQATNEALKGKSVDGVGLYRDDLKQESCVRKLCHLALDPSVLQNCKRVGTWAHFSHVSNMVYPFLSNFDTSENVLSQSSSGGALTVCRHGNAPITSGSSTQDHLRQFWSYIRLPPKQHFATGIWEDENGFGDFHSFQNMAS